MLANDQNIIPYRKELNAITGGVTATILLQQVSYWWKKSGSQPFYKFIQPCKHEKYHDGDSWTEELGFSRKEFLTAIKKLEDAGLVKKRTNASRLTYYSLDEIKLNQMLEGVYLNAERGFSKMPKGDLPLLSETTTETTTDLKPLSCKQDDVAKDNVERSLIDYLNQLSGRNYRPAPSNIKLLRARLAEGYTAQEIADVIARKCAEWIDDPKMAQFLRPATVFGDEKFNQYVGELGQPLPPKRQTATKPEEIDFESTGWLRT